VIGTRLKNLAELTAKNPREAAWQVCNTLKQSLDLSGRVKRLRGAPDSRLEVFSTAYDTRGWGSTESGSGTASELRATEVIRSELTDLLRRLDIKSLLDAPCGDWNWMQHIDLGDTSYIGADIVPSVIEANTERYERPGVSFMTADLTQDELPLTEAVMCRCCLVHVSYADAAAMLANFRRTGATWLLVSDYPGVTKNRDQPTSRRWRRLNMQMPPFNFPEPIETMPDGGEVDPEMNLSVWRFDDIPEITL
jgi:SAM-dependent methyltransferase